MRKVGPYYEVLDNINAWQTQAPVIAIDEAEKEADMMVIINQDDQLAKGIDAGGYKIEPKYSPLTVSLKKIKGQDYKRVTLHDEGDFYRGMHVERAGKGLYIDSKDSKTEKLVNKYGEDIFGLTRKNIKEFIQNYLRPRMQDRFKKAILP